MLVTSRIPTCPSPRNLRGAAGRQFAWAAIGQGAPAAVLLPGWLSHLGQDLSEGGRGRFIRAVAARRRAILFDPPGIGLADRTDCSFSLEDQLDRLLRVLDAAEEERVMLFAAGLSGPVAIAFAAQHPERVSHLVLHSTTASPRSTSSWPDGLEPELVETLGRLMRVDWRVAAWSMAGLLLTEASQDEAAEFVAYQLAATSGRVAAEALLAQSAIDVSSFLPAIMAPTLILHRRGDCAIAVTAARRLAGQISHAQVAIIEGAGHLPFAGDVSELVCRIEAFLEAGWSRLTPRELQCVALAAEGLSNRDMAQQMRISEATVARHLATVYQKVGVHGRRAVASYGRRVGLLSSA